MQEKKLLIQFNEANFDLIKQYSEKYNFVHLNKILSLNEIKTTSEDKYEHLEPWIQWYSFYTGLPFNEHQTFNLGDCLKNNHSNFIDEYAKKNKKICTFSSMNLKPSNNYATYIPDPWTESEPIGSKVDKLVSSNLRNIVNENASLSLNLKDLIGLFFLIGFPKNPLDLKLMYKSLVAYFKKDRSSLAAQFDYFISKYSLHRIKKENADLSLIFLNGLAHVQHHYYLNSEFVSGSNPSWYSNSNDNIYRALEIYDSIFSMIFQYTKKNNYTIWIITALTQKEYPNPFCYWRFKDHKQLISNFVKTKFDLYPRMTRDFEIKSDKKNINEIRNFLEESVVIDKDNKALKAFTNINLTSDETIFASFAYDSSSKNVELKYNNVSINLENELNFIALKNAGHVSNGWAFTNSEINDVDRDTSLPIWNLNKVIMEN